CAGADCSIACHATPGMKSFERTPGECTASAVFNAVVYLSSRATGRPSGGRPSTVIVTTASGVLQAGMALATPGGTIVGVRWGGGLCGMAGGSSSRQYRKLSVPMKPGAGV